MNIKHNFFKNIFFPSTLSEWNQLDPAIRNSTSNLIPLRKASLSLSDLLQIVPQCYNAKGMKYLTGLRVNFSHLCDHKFKHSFRDTINPLCTCSL